jgi:DNA-binding NarL/FixJ family response regulator
LVRRVFVAGSWLVSIAFNQHLRGTPGRQDAGVKKMPRIKCLLVDDHTLFRQGVRRLLESEGDFEVTGEAADGGEAVEKARELRPDVVLLDITMPGLSSFEAARQIKRNRIETKILFLTMYEDEDYLVQCLEAGASGYVLKDTPSPQLLSAVRDVSKGGKYVSSRVLGKMVEDFRSRVRSTRMRPRLSTLTPRELGILKLLAEGNSVKKIAVILGVSVKTVDSHKFNLMRKVDIHNTPQLVAYAVQKNIIKVLVNQ